MKKKLKIDEHDATIVYQAEDPGQWVLEFTDELIADTMDSKYKVSGKGQINKQIATYIYEYLEGYHIQTHFIKSLGTKELLLRNIEMFPLEVIIHNIANDDFSHRFGLAQFEELMLPVTEYFLFHENGQRIMINMSHALAFCHINADDFKTIERLAAKANVVLKSLFMRRNLKLMNIRLRFGKFTNKIMLATPLSLDTLSFLDPVTNHNYTAIWHKDNIDQAQQYYEKLNDLIFKT